MAKRFDIAFSLAGEQRALIEPVASELTKKHYSVFFYAWPENEAALAKPHLDLHLRSIYADQARLLVPVLSADYARKPWTQDVEFTVVREVIFDRRDDEVMPLRADDAPVEGFSKLHGYIDIRGRSAEEIADLIQRRLESMAGRASAPPEQAVLAAALPAKPINFRRRSGRRFYGRSEELKELADGLNAQERVIVIQGLAGVGKTALAQHAARRFADQFPGGAIDIALEPLPRVEDVLADLAEWLLGARARELTTMQQEREILQQVELLRGILVLDNCENLANLAGAAGPQRENAIALGRLFLDIGERTAGALLLTTTEPLPEFAAGAAIRLRGLDLLAALLIFRDYAGTYFSAAERQRISSWQRAAETGTALASVVQDIETWAEDKTNFLKALGCHPLAVRLVSTVLARDRPQGGTLPDVTQLLPRAKDLFGSGHHAALFDCFNYAYLGVPTDARDTFLRLTIFRAPFLAEGAAAVLDTDDVNAQLAQLHDAGLLHRTGADDISFYSLTPLARWFAEARLRDVAVDRTADTRRAAAYYSAAVDRIPASALQLMVPDLLLAFENLAGRERWTFGGRLAPILKAVGRMEDAIRVLDETSRGWAELGDAARRADALHEAGNLLRFRSEFPAAIERYTEALRIRREESQREPTAREGEAWTLHELANATRALGDLKAATKLYDQAMAIWTDRSIDEGKAWTLHETANAHRDLGQLDTAARLYSESLQAWARVPTSREGRASRAYTLTQLASVERLRHPPTSAFAHYRDALDIWRQIDFREGEALTLHDAATLLEWLGQLRAAEDMLERALGLHKRAGDLRGMASDWHELANVRRLQSQWDAADQLYRASLRIWTQTSDQQGKAVSHRGLGSLARDMAHFDVAQDELNGSLKLWRDIGSDSGIAYTLHELGVLENKRQRWVPAQQAFERALEIWDRMDDRRGRKSTLLHYAELLLAQGRRDDGRQRLHEALTLMGDLGGTTILASASTDADALLRRYGLAAELRHLLDAAKHVESREFAT